MEEGHVSGEVEEVTGLEEVLFDDSHHPYVAHIVASEFHLRFCTLKQAKNSSEEVVLRDRRVINFSSIVSIQHVKNSCKKYKKECVRSLRFQLDDAHFTRIFLRSVGKEKESKKEEITSVDVVACGFSRLHVQIMSLWHAQRLRASLCIDDKYGHSDQELADEYYREAVASLRSAAKRSDPLEEQLEILHEFADEVVSDIELKMICFKSKELFIILFQMYQTVVDPPTDALLHMKNKANAMTSESSKMKLNTEIEDIIYHKLLLFHAIIRVMHAILVSTQSIGSRFQVFSWGSRPLDLASWANLFIRDVYEDLCSMLKYKSGPLSEAEVNFELNKSFENVSISTPKRKKSSYGEDGAFFSTNKITNVFSDEMLTPLRQRVQKQCSMFGMNNRSRLGLLVRSIKDIQAMLAYSCVEACVTGRQAYQKNGDVIYPPPSLRIVDDVVRHPCWEDFVEDVMIRISHILDDMMVLDTVVKVIQKRLHVQNAISARIYSARSLMSPSSRHTTPRKEKSFQFDNIMSPRVGPPVDRVRMTPSPRHRSRKKPPTAPNRDLFASHIQSIFETQEVMLHNACSLIRLLVLDNSKIRSFLKNDVDIHWFGIMHSMNLLFPRPDEPKDDEREGLSGVDEDDEISSSAIGRFFSRKKKKANEKENEKDNKKKKEQIDPSASKKEEKGEVEDPLVARVPGIKKQTPVMLHMYGPPLYSHLTVPSWELCLLARGAIENCIELLDLDVKFYHSVGDEAIEDFDKIDAAVQSLLNKDKNHAPSLQASKSNAQSKPPISTLAMRQNTADGYAYNVSVPILSLPKKTSDSFEKRLPIGEPKPAGSSDTIKSGRIAARFKRK